MIGTAVVSLPWAFQQSGLVLGFLIAFTSFLISFYTCKLINICQGEDQDFSDTLKKYFGKFFSIPQLSSFRQQGLLRWNIGSYFTDHWCSYSPFCDYVSTFVSNLFGNICMVLWNSSRSDLNPNFKAFFVKLHGVDSLCSWNYHQQQERYGHFY